MRIGAYTKVLPIFFYIKCLYISIFLYSLINVFLLHYTAEHTAWNPDSLNVMHLSSLFVFTVVNLKAFTVDIFLNWQVFSYWQVFFLIIIIALFQISKLWLLYKTCSIMGSCDNNVVYYYFTAFKTFIVIMLLLL